MQMAGRTTKNQPPYYSLATFGLTLGTNARTLGRKKCSEGENRNSPIASTPLWKDNLERVLAHGAKYPSGVLSPWRASLVNLSTTTVMKGHATQEHSRTNGLKKKHGHAATVRAENRLQGREVCARGCGSKNQRRISANISRRDSRGKRM